MKYTVTSSEASKMLIKIMEEKNMALANEQQCCTFNASIQEDIESVRPKYSYEETQKYLEDCDTKIRILKHAINCFNTTQTVGDTGLTIDQVLVYIPQLTERKNRLFDMQSRLPKQRSSVLGMGNNSIIDYLYTNYSVEQAKEDYTKVSDELRSLQNALDLVNATIKMEFEIPD